MKVFYTHDIFSSQAVGGISRYFVELIGGMPGAGAKLEVFAGLHINEHLAAQGAGAARLTGVRVPAIPHTRFIRRNANDLFQRALVGRGSRTIVHQTYYFSPPRLNGAKLVLTVHDMIHELFPGDFREGDPTSRLKRQFCERADRIIAVSESTKADLVRLFGVDPAKVAVVHHGVPSFCRQAPGAGAETPVEPFLLYVGGRAGYKNFERFLRAYAASPRLRAEFRLVCFGGGRFNENELGLLAGLGIGERLTQIEGDDQTLVALYAKARALVYPSLYEGFGFPPLEAMSLGCPVICSRTSSLPEVVGEAGVYFEPMNVDEIRTRLETDLFDDAELAELARNGRSRAAGFSWEAAAGKTLAVYRSCL